MQIFYSYKAALQFQNLSIEIQRRIAEKMRFFSKQPNPLVFAKYITIRKAYRFRTGDYRIFFGIKDDMISIRTIERRDKAYE